MIGAVFFDFGGVLGRLDAGVVASMEERYGLPDGSFVQALYGIPEWADVEVGRRPEVEWLGAAERRLSDLAGHPVSGIMAERARLWRNIDRDVVRLAQSLKPSYRVGVLSNSTLRLESELLEGNGILDIFDVVVNSARVGVAKPDARIFHIAAEAIGVAPEACVHIDDLEDNVAGARKAGFQAVQYAGDFSALDGELRGLGLAW